jgi:hypothetical protein
MAPKEEFPVILIKRGKIWHYQVYVPGRGLWKRTTGKANYRQAEAEARKLHAKALLLSGSPEESLTLSKAIVREVDRISQSISEARAWRLSVCLENFIRWAGDIPLEKITTEMLARYQIYRASCKKKINVGIGEKKRRVEAKSGTRIATSTIVLEVQYVLRMLRKIVWSCRNRPCPETAKNVRAAPSLRMNSNGSLPLVMSTPQKNQDAMHPFFCYCFARGHGRPNSYPPIDPDTRPCLSGRSIMNREL